MSDGAGASRSGVVEERLGSRVRLTAHGPDAKGVSKAIAAYEAGWPPQGYGTTFDEPSPLADGSGFHAHGHRYVCCGG